MSPKISDRRAHDSETCAGLLITIGGVPCRKQIWRIAARVVTCRGEIAYQVAGNWQPCNDAGVLGQSLDTTAFAVSERVHVAREIFHLSFSWVGPDLMIC